MEVDDQKVAVMTEKVRRRASKWDVEAESRTVAEVKIDKAFPGKNDSSINFTDLNSTIPSLSMTINGSELDHSSTKSEKISDDDIKHSDVLFKMHQNTNLTDLESDMKEDCECVYQERSKADCVENQSIIHSDAVCEVTQNPMPIDQESDCKDGFKKQDWEHIVQEQTVAECFENQPGKILNNDILLRDVLCEIPEYPMQIDLEVDFGKDSFKEHASPVPNKDGFKEHASPSPYKDGFNKHVSPGPYKDGFKEHVSPGSDKDGFKEHVSPGPDEEHQVTHTISPEDVKSLPDSYNMPSKKRSWSRSRSRSPPYESRSRSRSWSRTRSPSYPSKQGSERLTDSNKMRRRASPCRDFIAGRCTRGSDCIYLHDTGGLRPVDREGQGSRNEKTNYYRDNTSRRHDEAYEGRRDNNEPNRGYRSSNPCFNFLEGRCDRGASCKYVHHAPSSDASRNARDESRSKPNDRTENGSGAPLSHGFERRHVSEVPCTFFLENRCRNGERCKFLHRVKPAKRSIESERRNQSTHFTPPVPRIGQMQQQVTASHPQTPQNQFPAFHQPPNPHFFNTNIQNQPSSHPLPYELNPQTIGQAQPNQLMQPDFNVGIPIQPNHLLAPPPPNPKITAEASQTSAQHKFNSSEPKPLQINPNDPIPNKLVTSEQAAKIVDLSASLAQFFGTTALNSQPAVGMAPQPFMNPGPLPSFASNVLPLPAQVDGLQTNVIRSTPLEEKPRKAETSKQQLAQQLANDEAKKLKEAKEAKDIRMFKCALIEFVKDLLKPKWKEGQLSKEAHKSIVKKVVEKVSGSLQGPNVPQTQDKIDMYLLASKPKLSKLVQAYVEKYVNA